MARTARIEVHQEPNGTWYVGIDEQTGQELYYTRYGRKVLTSDLQSMGYTVNDGSTVHPDDAAAVAARPHTWQEAHPRGA